MDFILPVSYCHIIILNLISCKVENLFIPPQKKMFKRLRYIKPIPLTYFSLNLLHVHILA